MLHLSYFNYCIRASFHLNYFQLFLLTTYCSTLGFRFTLEDQQTRVSIVQYYREKYGIGLKHVALPALQSGNDSKPVYLPMEVVLLFLIFFFAFKFPIRPFRG